MISGHEPGEPPTRHESEPDWVREPESDEPHPSDGRPRRQPMQVRPSENRSLWPEVDLRPLREDVRVPEGEYDARAFRANYKKSIGGERRLFIWFELIGGQADGVRLFMACPIPRNERPSPSSKFYQAWTIANGGRPPKRNDRMSLRIFENRLLRVRVVTVKTDYRQRTRPPSRWYSIVSEVIA
jgi:hypothetical protein